jgi:uncharacterized phiE125 gp8 family phage protein
MSLKLITPPTAEPLELADAKLHLRADMDDDTEDGYITSLIVAAREAAEHMTGRALITQTWELALDRFYEHRREFHRYSGDAYRIALPKPPLISVASVKYIDPNGIQQTMPEADYQVDIYSEPGRLVPAYNAFWPATRCQPNAVIIRYTVGYANAAAVPQQIKNWMLLRIGMLYENRESVSPGQPIQEMPQADRLLDAYRILGF